MKYFLVLILSISLVTLTGCKKPTKEDVGTILRDNKPLILAGIQIGSDKLLRKGLQDWEQKDPDSANEAATLLLESLDSEIIPFLNGQTEFTSRAQIDILFQASLLDNAPDEIKNAISAAFAVVDFYLKVPGADTLPKDSLDYIKAFCNGLHDACDKFLNE